MKRAHIAIIAVLVVIAIGGSILRFRGQPGIVAAPAPDIRAPDSVRIRVQVLNGTNIKGLARRATILLRDRGFDVVETGNVPGTVDTTFVLDLSGHPDWANRVAKIFGTTRIQTRRDSSRYLDIAVVLGTTWRPPAEPFYP